MLFEYEVLFLNVLEALRKDEFSRDNGVNNRHKKFGWFKKNWLPQEENTSFFSKILEINSF